MGMVALYVTLDGSGDPHVTHMRVATLCVTIWKLLFWQTVVKTFWVIKTRAQICFPGICVHPPQKFILELLPYTV